MSNEYVARRVVAAVRADGTEGVVSDEPAPVRVSTPMATTVDLWAVDHVPTPLSIDESARDVFLLDPPANGLVVRIGVLQPDSSWRTADLDEMFGALGAAASHHKDSDIRALHSTKTVDTATVLQGAVYAVLQSEEVLLRAGDTLVQLGTKHAWSNRGGEPTVIVFTQIAATKT